MDRARLSSVVCSNRTRGNGQKLEHRKFHTNMHKNCFTVRVTEHWSRLPREVVSFSGDIQDLAGDFPAQPTAGNLLFAGGWTWSSPEVPSNPYDCDSVFLKRNCTRFIPSQWGQTGSFWLGQCLQFPLCSKTEQPPGNLVLGMAPHPRCPLSCAQQLFGKAISGAGQSCTRDCSSNFMVGVIEGQCPYHFLTMFNLLE